MKHHSPTKVQLAAGRNSERQRGTASGNSPRHNKQCEVILQYHNSTRLQGKKQRNQARLRRQSFFSCL